MANQVAWVGTDGNLWWNQNGEVINAGPANKYEFTNGGLRSVDFSTPLGQGSGFAPGVDQINDPNAGAVLGSNTAPAVGGGSGATRPILDQAAVDNTQQTISEIPGLLSAALGTEQTRYDNTGKQFDAQETAQQKTYDTSTTTNQQNYDSNFMDSIRAGIHGLGGLMNILRGTGASGGTAEGQAQDIVGGVTSQDIRTGADTQQENQRALDTSLSSFLTDLSGRRRENEDTFENNQRAIRRDSNTQLQELYGKMAGYFGDAEMTPERQTWMNKAGDLTPKIAQDSRTQLSKYNQSPIEVTAPELTAFAGPSQPNLATAPTNGQVGSGIFTIGDRRERERQPELAGA